MRNCTLWRIEARGFNGYTEYQKVDLYHNDTDNGPNAANEHAGLAGTLDPAEVENPGNGAS
ncbi:MAG: hypothetical protein C5B58_10280 [Acidobacteria bacterium]|nr:MAG: hypothetical protein C5B58_10280 [Acidobacteriota bacterium]